MSKKKAAKTEAARGRRGGEIVVEREEFRRG